ncbi:enoyl-CoA hydratase [Corynebacterium pseudotuberculosis]|uniref:Enoyl-CoA hydratase n=1 Tax=Corynebacterium pseudotuberculosis 258 TaxID=1168865 RepID=A0AAU8Q049_CORPS|nr:enoyl-CoA hydratase [Corynebacterium pseudotuberculosis]AEQ06168.2 enoyl-CoA hydratase [Corynebacterium pseudotuberculosis CIP 52.97]AFB71948.1 enoyl-CoA hydratase [Corynebacterium pseudotuberculosis 316]AFH90441.1 enoyl-CoA hydratase [Corynebacterium pseudotuberculosis 31]AFK16256.1 enoyl-CoA hydratase [Corynebacterium pseudotuberculosis 258]AKS12955.1 Enoyl-CoA hydratase [Corynebacterium pseudotuberculosis]
MLEQTRDDDASRALKEIETVKVSSDGFVRHIVLDRDDRRNALSGDMCRAIAHAVTEASAAAVDNASVRAIMISGVGRAFCAGADLGSSVREGGEHSSDGAVYGAGFHDALFAMLHSIIQAEVPIIANVQGAAVGAGMQLALACDLRVVGESAWFKVPAVSLGFALDGWTIGRAQKLCGGAFARNLLLAGASLTPDAALASGFAAIQGDHAAAVAFAHEVAGLAPLSVRQLKSALNYGEANYSLDERSQSLFSQCWSSQDMREARQARLEKRVPQFKGR